MNMTELARSLNMTEDQLWKVLNQSVGLQRTGGGGYGATARTGLTQNYGDIPAMNRRRIGGGFDTNVPQYLGGKLYDPREQWGSGPYVGRTMGFSDLPFGGFHMTGEQIAKAGARYNERNYFDVENQGQQGSFSRGSGDISTATSAIKRLRETLKSYMDYSTGNPNSGTDTSYTEPGLVDASGPPKEV